MGSRLGRYHDEGLQISKGVCIGCRLRYFDRHSRHFDVGKDDGIWFAISAGQWFLDIVHQLCGRRWISPFGVFGAAVGKKGSARLIKPMSIS